jgi:hypothetical protein
VAMRSASSVDSTPTCSPCSLTKRTGEMRI